MPNDSGHQKTAPRQARTTLADVAAQAGVSTVAASVVLNGARSDVRVSAATRQRIIEAGAALQYRPHAVARSLRQQRTNVIAFYNAQNTIFNPRYPFFAAILAGIQAGCEEQHKDLLIHGRFGGRSDDDIFMRLLNGQIDGLVFYARTVTPLIERLIESHLPVVTVAEQIPGLPYVGIDEAGGSRMLVRHLAERGYQKVLYRVPDEVLPSTLEQRIRVFAEEAEALGLQLSQSRTSPSSHLPTAQEREILLNNEGQRPHAVACWGDISADGMAEFCMQEGWRVPHDLAIVGFDGLPSMRRPALRLTTIGAPWAEVARTAVKLLAAQCAGQEVPQETILPVELLVGDTT